MLDCGDIVRSTGTHTHTCALHFPNATTTGKTIRTNRLSVTERFKPLHREGQPRLQGDSHAHDDRTSVLPGVFFIYDLSPFAVRVFLINACVW